MAPLPVLELLVAAGTAERVEPLVQRLRRWSDPRAPDPGLGQPAARFATSTAALGVEAALTHASCPVAVWLDADVDRSEEPWAKAAALVTDEPGVAVAIGERSVLVPRDHVDADRYPFLPAFLRREWRRRFELPEPMLIGLGAGDTPAFPADVSETALALASAAAVTGGSALLALALGTPTVTDPTTAEWIGAADGEHVVVATAADALEAARILATDPDLCARLGWAGRRLVEQRHDITAAAGRLAEKLGLTGTRGGTPERRLGAHLDELGTPTGSRPRTRALAAMVRQ